MPKGKVRVKTIKQGGGGNEGVAEMFNQMLGAGETVDMKICYPKYESLKANVKKLMNVVKLLEEGPLMKMYAVEHKDSIEEISKFRTVMDAKFKELFSFDFSEHLWNLNLVPDDDKKAFSTVYRQLKEDKFMTVLVSICNNLIVYRKNLTVVSDSDYKFILNIPGVEFAPLVFTNLNLKTIFLQIDVDKSYNHALSKEENERRVAMFNNLSKMMLLILSKIYNLTYSIYTDLSSPDVDVNEFVEVVINNLAAVKKQIPRCNKAFKKIEESVNLLKSNFGNYYRDFVETKNQTIIMENFVLDVAKNTNADSETTRQFREIIKYYKKVAGSQITDPKLKMLFDKVNESFSQLDQHDNIARAQRGEDESSDDSSEEVAISPKEMLMRNRSRVLNSNFSPEQLADMIMSGKDTKAIADKLIIEETAK